MASSKTNLPKSNSLINYKPTHPVSIASNASFGVFHFDSEPVPDDDARLEDIDSNQVPWLTSHRFRLAILSFFGFAVLYAQRVNLSIAMVAMVSQKQHVISSNITTAENTSDRCPSLSKTEMVAEFHWDKPLVGLILGAFFWGYLVLQVPGGRLSERFGAKRVVAFNMFPVAILNLLTPVAARTSPYLLLVLRVFVGVGESVMYPSIQALWAQWAPPTERTVLIGLSFAGGQFGNALMFPIGGYLCAYGLDGGWPSVFYFIGSVGFLWCVLWVIFAHDSPNESPRISSLERQFINVSLGHRNDNVKPKRPPVPWKSILTSPPFLAILIGHTCGNYGVYMMLTKIPAYMKEVLKFDIKSNGLYSMLPYLSIWFVIVIGGIVADLLIRHQIFSVKITRKLFAFLGFVLPGVSLIGVGFMECDQANAAVVLLCISVGLCGLQFCSVYVNHSDIAPMYAGTLFGITNTMATVPGIISPYVVSAMTPNASREEWQSAFYLAAAIYFFGGLGYCLLCEANVQPWAAKTVDGEDTTDNANDVAGNGVAFRLEEIDDATTAKDATGDDDKKGKDLLASVKLISKNDDEKSK